MHVSGGILWLVIAVIFWLVGRTLRGASRSAKPAVRPGATNLGPQIATVKALERERLNALIRADAAKPVRPKPPPARPPAPPRPQTVAPVAPAARLVEHRLPARGSLLSQFRSGEGILRSFVVAEALAPPLAMRHAEPR